MPEISPANLSHFDELLVLVAEFHEIAHLPFSVSGTGDALRGLLENQQLGCVLMARESSMPVGCVVVGFGYSLEFGGRDAFIDELYVRPAFQARGIGTALLREAEKFASQLGVNALHLESDFDNPRATALYKSKAYHQHPRFLMTKWLNEASDLRPDP